MSPLLRRPDGYSDILPSWHGMKVVILGGGPSLILHQVRAVQAAHEISKVKCIAVNDTYLLAPWADICYFSDSNWWEWHHNGIAIPKLSLSALQVKKKFDSFLGYKVSRQGSGSNIKDGNVHLVRRGLLVGNNSGVHAIMLAQRTGAATIILVGFDGGPDVDGQTHWFGEHPLVTSTEEMEAHTEEFHQVPGLKVINATPGTKIPAFPIMTLQEALDG